MRCEQRGDDRLDAVAWNDGLDAQLRRPLLLARRADGRLDPFAAQERACSSRVPGAALIVADPARSGGEDGVARRVQRLLRHEPDELVPLFSQVCAA
jgi:hypothetical protein